MKTRIVCLTTVVFSLFAMSLAYGDEMGTKECPKGKKCQSICKECPGKKCHAACNKTTAKHTKKQRSRKFIDPEVYKQEGNSLLNDVQNLKNATKKEEWKLFYKINRFVKKAGDNTELGETAKMVINEAKTANKFKNSKIIEKLQKLQPGKKTRHSKMTRSKKSEKKHSQKKKAVKAEQKN